MANQVPNRLLFGLDRLFGIFQADQNKHLLLHFQDIFREFGHTLKARIVFHTLHATIDPRNVEAILHTHFTGKNGHMTRLTCL